MDRGEGTRDRILDIAERLVFERGFNGTSLNDIMTEADLTKGAFFHHFSDKNELARAVLHQRIPLAPEDSASYLDPRMGPRPLERSSRSMPSRPNRIIRGW